MSALKDIQHITNLDRELVVIISDFHLLSPLNWSIEVQKEFLTQAKKRNYILPEVVYPKNDYSEKIEVLKKYLVKLGTDEHPAIAFLRSTADSYLTAYYILQGVGTSAVTEYSKELYGAPQDHLVGYKRSNLDVARYFLRVVKQYNKTIREEPLIYSAQEFALEMQKKVCEIIPPDRDVINITVDEKIIARAAAGPNYVKIRKDAFFSHNDLLQLVNHEVFTHTLTYLNGRKQPVLQSLGYSSPRITTTQEGLAVFSEYISMSIELVRLQRIALRIVALSMAEDGANLIDLYKFFKHNGENSEESYFSAMRTLRGGTPKGGIIFYKDNIYLKGLMEVESFLKKSMHNGTLHHIALLFTGKLTTQDVLNMRPLMEQGYIIPPVYMPSWALNSSELAAHLAFNDITERFKIKS